ncbi:MAG TPA: hypothetical protein VMR25_14940 [Planctomycetaceae bacterium]|nr:hypothetical protein [Planctomycetaceae bacterium]
MSALMCAMAACMVVEVVAITLDRYERTKQLDQLNVELKQLEIRLQQIQKASDKRDKRDFKEKREPAKAKPDAAGNKSSQLHRLDWPGGRLVDDRLAMPGVSWTGSVLA